ncbi:VanW family protein [Alkalihalobacillus trypoxylicola]|uniref:Peptidoglycan binding domain-containing protein n=1 Tax=Alkalihalobacillus trypoxylicola TaxID=519424 RepID=A0A162F4E7_9BACI|nr:VanW family protein [Alkalihalobacillus trypoxylicola]KYG34782.1 hypothetical protein AZF04_00150 [Alkalihalobacillus trypoxylicola]
MLLNGLICLFLFLHPIDQIADDLTLTIHNQKVEQINREDFRLLATNKEWIDQKAFNLIITNLTAKYQKPAKNAYISDYGDIMPEENGYKVDAKKLADILYEYFYSIGKDSVEIPIIPVYPKVDSELLESIQKKQIGSYVTFFNQHNLERSHNIELATKAIHNNVVFPKERFSFNVTVGERTPLKGYKKATVIVKGELSEGIGGGICQVSSTLFNAVDAAQLSIIERYIHSRKVSYVPPGRDATVSWAGPDFIFLNDFNQPILIQARIYGGMLSVTILSSENIQLKK